MEAIKALLSVIPVICSGIVTLVAPTIGILFSLLTGGQYLAKTFEEDCKSSYNKAKANTDETELEI